MKWKLLFALAITRTLRGQGTCATVSHKFYDELHGSDHTTAVLMTLRREY